MKDLIFNEFKACYPLYGEHAIKYWENGPYEIYIRLDDGKILAFDFIDRSVNIAKVYKEPLTDEDRMYEFGRRLRRIMYIKGLTQKDLSKSTGISQTMVSFYINGRSIPSFDKLDKICRVLGCSMDELRCMDRENV